MFKHISFDKQLWKCTGYKCQNKTIVYDFKYTDQIFKILALFGIYTKIKRDKKIQKLF